MSMNVQLIQTLIQLTAMREMNNTNTSIDESAGGLGESFSSILGELIGGDPLLGMTVANESDSPSFPSAMNNSRGLESFNILSGVQPSTSLASSNDPKDFDSYIQEASARYGVDPKLIRAIIRHESGFNPTSISSAGAIGLMQLMPGTARSLGVTDPLDPKQNIEGGTKYLRKLLDTFNNNEALALAAYNAGPANVKKYNGIPPFKETEQYVQRVLQTYMS
ncbi:MAG: lytic transglycosylase domain-containing protein [Tuberibacillus sp.]